MPYISEDFPAAIFRARLFAGFFCVFGAIFVRKQLFGV